MIKKITLNLISFALTFSIVIIVFKITIYQKTETEVVSKSEKQVDEYLNFFIEDSSERREVESIFMIDVEGCSPCINNNLDFIGELCDQDLLKKTMVILIGRKKKRFSCERDVNHLFIDSTNFNQRLGLHIPYPQFYFRDKGTWFSIEMSDISFESNKEVVLEYLKLN